MDIKSVNLDEFYQSLKGIVRPPIQQVKDAEEEPLFMFAVKESFYWLAKLLGWQFKGEIPADVKKGVVVIAPHTSTLDLIFGLAAYRHFENLKGHYLAKKELFESPLRLFYELTGGIPVDRTNAKDTVEQIARKFQERDHLFIAIAPEGTRKKTKKWKSGFYRIALQADVPIILAYLDYDKKEAGIGDIIYPTGNYEADAKKMEAFYKNVSALWAKDWNWRIV